MSDIPGVVDELHPDYQVAKEQEEAEEAETAYMDVRKSAENRMGAYARMFVGGTPSKEDREIVMADLMRFTRGESTPWDADARFHAVLTCRHEVWTRIKDHTKLSLDEFILKYHSKATTQE